MEIQRRRELRGELERHHEAAFGWALHCCRGDREEARDVLHTAYLKALDGTARFEGRSSLRTWLFSVIRLTALQRRRRWRRRIKLLERQWRLGLVPAARRESPSTADARLQRSELRRTFEKLLGGLSHRQRDLMHLVFYQDLTVEEAASVLGVSLGSARVHYHRGKQKLRKQMEEIGVIHDGTWRQGNQRAL